MGLCDEPSCPLPVSRTDLIFPNVDRRVLALTAWSHKAPAAAWDASRGDIPCFRHKRSALRWHFHLLPRWLGNLSGEWLCEFQHSPLLIQVTLTRSKALDVRTTQNELCQNTFLSGCGSVDNVVHEKYGDGTSEGVSAVTVPGSRRPRSLTAAVGWLVSAPDTANRIRKLVAASPLEHGIATLCVCGSVRDGRLVT